MIVSVAPSRISGSILAAAGKSSMQRACAAALVRKGKTVIQNPGKSNDDLAALDVIQKLGAVVKQEADGSITIVSAGVAPASDEVNCGESGLGIRMFTPIAALATKQITLNGSGSLLTRPLDFFDNILPQLGVQTQSNNGKLPLVIKGPLQPADITVDGSLSSQFLTGLLMAYGAAGADHVTIKVNDLKSKPYIDLTLRVMEDFGWQVENRNYEEFVFTSASQKTVLETITYAVEGDWSGAAFLLVAGAIAGDITVKGLQVDSTQADKAILQALAAAGCRLSVRQDEIEVGPLPLKAFHFDATDCPDLFPPLVALAAYCEGTTVIEGADRLTHKESNRAITLQEEFGKLGIEIRLQDNLMLVTGTGKLKQAEVHSHHDHRIAMACAVAALKADGPVVIAEADAINKSYPGFYEHLQLLGATVTTIQ
ncbi:3-phosphoshikimate 1-carboxyvinyltransferase [Sediminibacterium ginsengisoli]|uniref:3-phosphoshikimate 1-carboxyvinyltransferase n=1 Tax=Sediminibacterium ginsengisoli TaxID=413434 RepID=A0A1T4QT70_9BACT|nr:3-phosphoshikimate 1-carboxyvinyltransferase [Sediminibacterium ginsengisoli]SKA06920.1 3-phosphoshikimate 1-carboxyvinyltransferase [Sediminibacterium ginsengisoli]